MTCTAKSYVATGGMNRRMAGEDFYFLQKLAKTDGVDLRVGKLTYTGGQVIFQLINSLHKGNNLMLVLI